jgi:GAF domain-containing protein
MLKKKRSSRYWGSFQGTSTELIEQIEANYNNSKLTNEIGEAIASQTTIEGVLSKVVQLFERRLNYDRGMIMLANAEKSRLIFRAGFGYTNDKLNLLKQSAFHLDRPDAKGVFVACFNDQKPYLINDISEIGHRLSARSQAFAREMGSQALYLLPHNLRRAVHWHSSR